MKLLPKECCNQFAKSLLAPFFAKCWAMVLAVMMLGVPAFSQDLSCSGKPIISFPDGGTGCVQAIEPASLAFWRSGGGWDLPRDRNPSAVVLVLMQSGFAERGGVWTSRLRYVCEAYKTEMLALTKNDKQSGLHVQFVWPPEIAPRSAVVSMHMMVDEELYPFMAVKFSKKCKNMKRRF